MGETTWENTWGKTHRSHLKHIGKKKKKTTTKKKNMKNQKKRETKGKRKEGTKRGKHMEKKKKNGTDVLFPSAPWRPRRRWREAPPWPRRRRRKIRGAGWLSSALSAWTLRVFAWWRPFDNQKRGTLKESGGCFPQKRRVFPGGVPLKAKMVGDAPLKLPKMLGDLPKWLPVKSSKWWEPSMVGFPFGVPLNLCLRSVREMRMRHGV